MQSLYKTTANEKTQNILAILNNIAHSENISAIDIAHSTHLSVATVSRALKLLREERLITAKGKEITDMGRHPEMLSLNPDYGCYVHFYLKTEMIEGYLVDFMGNVILSRKLTITRNIEVEEFVDLVYSLANLILESKKIPYKKIIAASLAVPGLVDDENKNIRRIPNFINFKDVNLFDILSKKLEIPVIINNTARLSAVGEHIHSYPHMSNITYIDFTNYNGIGAGILINGKLFTGAGGFAGEIGDMLTDTNDFNKVFNEDQGSLETQAGLGMLFDRVRIYLLNGRAKILKRMLDEQEKDELDLRRIEEAVMAHDLDVIDAFEEVIKKWAVAIINLAVVVNPDIIILGGVVNKENQYVYKKIKHYISKVLYHDIEIELCKTDSDAQLYGGIYMLKQYTINKIIINQL